VDLMRDDCRDCEQPITPTNTVADRTHRRGRCGRCYLKFRAAVRLRRGID